MMIAPAQDNEVIKFNKTLLKSLSQKDFCQLSKNATYKTFNKSGKVSKIEVGDIVIINSFGKNGIIGARTDAFFVMKYMYPTGGMVIQTIFPDCSYPTMEVFCKKIAGKHIINGEKFLIPKRFCGYLSIVNPLSIIGVNTYNNNNIL